MAGATLIGSRIGRYRILEELGAGGMGVVYRAQDERLPRVVAIKILATERWSDADSRRRFEREARLLSRLNHPNIATLHDFESSDGLELIVMELVPGRTLAEVLLAGPLAEAEALRIGSQLAGGLAAAHASGVLHRDLKPGNLKLTPDGRLKILDFGVGKGVHTAEAGSDDDTITRGQEAVGTLAYMSPEQVRGDPVDARADVYSAGCVLYEMITGRRPHGDLQGYALMHAILNEPPLAPRALRPDVSPACEALVLRALEKPPAQRTPDARTLAAEIAAVTAADPLPAASQVRAAPSRSAPRARRWSWRLAGAFGLVASLAIGWFVLRGAVAPGAATAGRTMLAVLPFENLGSEDGEFFSDGLTEEMITELGRLTPDRLGVIARTSAMHYKGTRKTIRAIGRELGVEYVLSGSVRRADRRVRIAAELSAVQDQAQVWSETFERDLADVFEIQADVARRIADVLAVKLVPGWPRPGGRAPTRNVEAHDAYLLGRYEWNRRSEDGLRRAIEHFDRARTLDPRFARAWAGLADAHLLLGTYGFEPRETALPRARDAAERALALDDRLSDAHASLGLVAEELDRDGSEAERHYRRALELDPGNATARQWLAGLLTVSGRVDDGVRELERAASLDPRSIAIHSDLAATLYYARRHRESAAQCRRALGLDSTFVPAWNTLGLALWQAGDHREAVGAWQHALAHSGASPADTAGLALAYARGGPDSIWRWMLDWLRARAGSTSVSPYAVATAYAALGEADAAIEWLELAFRQDPSALATLGLDAMFDPLRDDPRFQSLVARTRLAPA